VAVLALLAVLAACAGTDLPSSQVTVPAETLVAPTTTPPPGLPTVPRLTMFGDSTALMSSWGLLTELTRTGRAQFVEGFTGLGCAVLRTDTRRIAGEVEDTDPTCNNWATVWQGQLDAGRPDIVVVQTGSWDVADRQLAGDPEWRGPGDPLFDAFALSEMLAAVDMLSAGGAVVVWLTSPAPGAIAYESERVQRFDPAPRHRRLDELIRQLPGLRPSQVAVVDLSAWLAAQSPEEDLRLRPDGVHFEHDTSVDVCVRHLCDAVLRAARELRPGPPPAPRDTALPAPAPIVPPTAPGARDQARQALLGLPLYDAGLAASAAGWRVRVDADAVFDQVPVADDQLVIWWWTGYVNDVR
jgi:hypothetical protein